MKFLTKFSLFFIVSFLSLLSLNSHAKRMPECDKVASHLCVLSLKDGGFVTLSQGWVRASTAGQSVGAAYLTFNSRQNATLVGAESVAAAGSIEIHSMTMTNGVMKMRRLETLKLPANQAVALKAGGFHFMLFDLKKPLKLGDTVLLTLHIKDTAGNLNCQNVALLVKASEE